MPHSQTHRPEPGVARQREPRDRKGRGIAVVIGPYGTTTTLAPPGSQPYSSDVTEFPLGWLDADPVVWRQTKPASRDSHGRGEVTTSLHPAPSPACGKRSLPRYRHQPNVYPKIPSITIAYSGQRRTRATGTSGGVRPGP